MIIIEQKLASHHPENAPYNHPVRDHTSHPISAGSSISNMSSPLIIQGQIDPHHHSSSLSSVRSSLLIIQYKIPPHHPIITCSSSSNSSSLLIIIIAAYSLVKENLLLMLYVMPARFSSSNTISLLIIEKELAPCSFNKRSLLVLSEKLSFPLPMESFSSAQLTLFALKLDPMKS